MIFLRYAVWRFITMLLTLWVVSLLVFVIINLPPGDYLSNQIAELRATGQAEGVAKAEFLRHEYALDEPIWKQYLIWVGMVPLSGECLPSNTVSVDIMPIWVGKVPLSAVT